ncbi:MAG TPA: hypothetical protein VF950_09955 [Planctomycetota bacterium]
MAIIQRPLPPRAQAVAAPSRPRPTPAARPPRRGVWTFFSFFLFALSLLGGEIAAHYRPELALKFRGLAAGLLGGLPESTTPAVLLQLAGGAAALLILLLIWQAGSVRRPLFWPLALFLCLVSAAVGLHRGGRDIDLERNVARLRTLETDLGALRSKLDVASGSLQQSALALRERDETLSKLREEIEALKKRLEEKPD